jgi:hypothetical protein
VRLCEDSSAEFLGVNMGNGTTPIRIWHEEEVNLVLNIPGGKHWTGRGMDWASHPDEYLVTEFDVTATPGEPDRYGNRHANVQVMFTMPLTSPKEKP